jgi:hypothetical protein
MRFSRARFTRRRLIAVIAVAGIWFWIFRELGGPLVLCVVGGLGLAFTCWAAARF